MPNPNPPAKKHGKGDALPPPPKDRKGAVPPPPTHRKGEPTRPRGLREGDAPPKPGKGAH
jgi:hypothetical protein